MGSYRGLTIDAFASLFSFFLSLVRARPVGPIRAPLGIKDRIKRRNLRTDFRLLGYLRSTKKLKTGFWGLGGVGSVA